MMKRTFAQGLLANLVASSEDGIICTDLDGRILIWNATAERIYGYTAAEMLGTEGIFRVYPPDRIAEAKANLACVRRGEPVKNHASVQRRKDGTLLAVEVTISPVYAAGGRIVGASAVVRDITERSQKAEALQSSQVRLRQLIEHASDGVFIGDLDGRLVEINPAGCAMFDYSSAELLGHNLDDFLQEPGLSGLQDELLVGNGRAVLQWAVRRKDGTLMPVEVSIASLPGDQWLGFARDIRERKQAELALRCANMVEQRLRRQLEAIAQATAEISEAVAMLPNSDVNVVLQAILLQAQALTGARYAALGIGTDPQKPFDPWLYSGVTPEEAAALGSPPRPMGSLKIPGFLDIPIIYRSKVVGNLLLANKQGASDFTAEDKTAIELLAARVGTALETARLYKEVAQANQWLQSVIDQMPSGVVLADASGRILSYNRAALELASGDTGMQDPFGNPLLLDARAPSGEPLPPEQQPLWRTIVNGETIAAMELVLRDREERLIPVMVSTTQVRSEKGVLGALAIIQDISARKEWERQREEWAAVIAHDLRQPVSVISLAMEYLSRALVGKLAPKESSLISGARANAGRLRRMIDDLLDASCIEANRLAIERRPLDLQSFLPELVARSGLGNERRPIRLELTGALWVDADPVRLEQVLINLLSNAIKYGEADTPIRVTGQAAGKQVLIAVENRGRGILPAELGRLFTRFYRGSRTRAEAQGLGIGLYITRGLVEAHGGRIWAESTPGGRTAFLFTLPARV